ncbi:hypothetical protein SAMN04487895_12856 [Paenibacillus sophorae]|uniref:Uncharacterized protein n=1 Tax=Paenibacillus sophorae TaxID=1333845 RepID=A0A1H8VXK8_9BACL|nr:hypothetical protein [Paenibacillus sophorae]QWU15611.1 hypothetical protein KP014_27875 [Paenibacillus sophorae]SEP19967.1 hypothetical protein SAMN04487895_12856 [Paenibacillus sophorae]
MEMIVERAEIKLKRNPWMKKMKRPIFTDGTRLYIPDNGIQSIKIEGRNYREVKKIFDFWYLI